MVDRRRHTANARVLPGPARRRAGAPTPALYRGSRGRSALRDIYASEHGEPRPGGRFRWLLSTCLAAGIGALAIIVVVYGSADPRENSDGIIPALKRMSEATNANSLEAALRKDDGLRWAIPKSDRLAVVSGTMTTRYMIHDTLKQRRGNRDYIFAKPYIRLVMRLAAVPPNYADVIPPFNPYKLYANTQPISSGGEEQASEKPSDVDVRIVELLGGILPGEDGQELETREVDDIVERAQHSQSAVVKDEGTAAPSAPSAGQPSAFSATDASLEEAGPQPNTTTLAKPSSQTDELVSDIEGLKRFQKTAGEGDTLTKILSAAGADTWITKSILEAARPIFKDDALKPGFEVQIGLAPSVTEQNKLEPVLISVFDEGHAHKVTVLRNDAGEFTASADPVNDDLDLRVALANQGDGPQLSSLYSSLYAAALMQEIPPETIQQILRIHATETDFRRRARPGDTVELLFDLKDEQGLEGAPGELLYTAITTGGETRRFYRFRDSEGAIDFYDEEGNNSRKFLTRRPVRGDDVRLVSGFGMRHHPLLGIRRMHTGVDWASPTGTPILAAGNGIIEEAGRKGGYGNYIRIRHANGYQTAYGHISRYAPGLHPGVKIKQNQVIAYVGCTGLCQGPHVHFEVLINNQFVDPFSIKVPNERQLAGEDMQEFQSERVRVDDLKVRAPVATATR